jgi:hypothetical protein
MPTGYSTRPGQFAFRLLHGPGIRRLIYLAVAAFIINLVIAVAASQVFGVFRLAAGTYEPRPS